nr:hypothetical protein [Tanacetum cinerariifolium]
MAPTSVPVNTDKRYWTTGQWRRTTGQRWRTTVVIDGQWWQSITVISGGPSFTTVEPPLTTARPPLPATGPPLDNRSTVVGRPVRPGLGWVWIWSGSDMGWVSHEACHVSATCAHVASTWMLTWIIYSIWESNPVPLAQRLKGYPKSQLS